MNEGNTIPISLLAKWLPSPKTSSKETMKKSHIIRHYLKLSESEYRKILSELRYCIDVTEKKMSANQWNDINYSHVPSKANIIYRKAFDKHDHDRRQEYLHAVASGKEKINASVLFPHEIVHSYLSHYTWKIESLEYDQTLEELWKNLPKVLPLNNSRILVMVDDSGSMAHGLPNTVITLLTIATSIGLYCAENLSSEFKDCYMTFSMNPQLLSFKDCLFH